TAMGDVETQSDKTQAAAETTTADGREVESFAVLAQRQGAKAVFATLWQVADESTAKLMPEFYRLREMHKGMNKAEALQQAQLKLLKGQIKASEQTIRAIEQNRSSKVVGSTESTKDLPEFKFDPNVPYSHPYFWAPFILIGNYR